MAGLCLLMTSCRSLEPADKPFVPDLCFPVFPEIERTVNPDGSWLVPAESVDRLAVYYLEITATENTYKRIKKTIEEGGE